MLNQMQIMCFCSGIFVLNYLHFLNREIVENVFGSSPVFISVVISSWIVLQQMLIYYTGLAFILKELPKDLA